VLRLLLGLVAVAQALSIFTSAVAAGVVLGAAGGCILLGLLTPVSAATLAAIMAAYAVSWLGLPDRGLIDSRLVALLLAGIALAVSLLGPGAISLDARLFGRREIVFPHDPPHS